jgi:hypothetical protein
MKVARQNSVLEFNSFTRGLITEASPLTFPDNASIDEINFNLNRNGSRGRRLGMDYEIGFVETQFGANVATGGSDVNITSFLWTDASRDNQSQIIAMQVGNEVGFFDASVVPISSGFISKYTSFFDLGKVQFSSVSSRLLMVDGSSQVVSFEYIDSAIVTGFNSLLIRDQFGVEDLQADGTDLRQGNNNQVRPTNLTDNHLYNLRNQGWSTPRRAGNREFLSDPIQYFFDVLVHDPNGAVDLFGNQGTTTRKNGLFPSNSDQVSSALYPDAEDGDDRVGERFFAQDLVNNHDRLGEAARGHFIIDALNRGTSRMQNLADMVERVAPVYDNTYSVSSLNIDRTTGGPSCVVDYAGRAWYGGFPSSIDNGDTRSPLMSNYVLFSRLVESTPDLFSCYQLANPTSAVDSDLVETDGGFVRISGAEKIIAMEAVGDKLLVFATNGVWSVSGTDNSGFSATGYVVTKVTDAGTESPNSIVTVDSSIFYWGVDGIYVIGTNEFGTLVATNTTSTTIQSVYQQIPYEDKRAAFGAFDKFDRKVKWLYYNRITSSESPKELTFDIDLKAFYLFSIGREVGQNIIPVSIVQTPPYIVGFVLNNVVIGGDNVVAGGDNVSIVEQQSTNQFRELKYLTISQTVPSVSITLSEYRDNDFLDWTSTYTGGTDAAAYLLTGHVSGGDFQRNKQIPYLTSHMTRTEDGFELINNVVTPKNQSGCLLSGRFEWANSVNSGRWSNPQQIYRYKRLYMPADLADPYDSGFETIVAKSRIRGKGRVVSFLFETEPGKDCKLLGWSILVGLGSDV